MAVKLEPITQDSDPWSMKCKIYNDGHHFVATQFHRKKKENKRKKENPYTYADMVFNNFYFDCVKAGISKQDFATNFKNYVEVDKELKEVLPDTKKVDEYLTDKFKQVAHNLYNRIKRLKRKAYLNQWNFFVTLTYDNKKMDAETFRKKLKKCLSNFSTRRGWRYAGVFEISPTTKRLHFHAIMYIPEDQMVGELEQRKDYSTVQKKMQITISNSFFLDKFGRNDFAYLNDFDLRSGTTIDYITKYLSKSNDYIVYSRGIPSEIIEMVMYEDIAAQYTDFVIKYCLYDDVIDDNLQYHMYRFFQQSFDLD